MLERKKRKESSKEKEPLKESLLMLLKNSRLLDHKIKKHWPNKPSYKSSKERKTYLTRREERER
jgi:predicted transposase YbfD/YdcC